MANLGPDALGDLVDRHAAALELFALQWTESAADVVQIAFVKLASQSDPPQHAASWLYRVVRNTAISTARSENRRRRHEQQVTNVELEWFSNRIEDRLDGQEAARALADLPVAQREVIVARIWGHLTFQEIAEVCEISVSSAHRAFETGIEILRCQLGVTWLKTPE